MNFTRFLLETFSTSFFLATAIQSEYRRSSRVLHAVLENVISSGRDIFTAVYSLLRRGPSPTDSNKTFRASRRANRATLRLRNLFFSWELPAAACMLSLSPASLPSLSLFLPGFRVRGCVRDTRCDVATPHDCAVF